jgi:transposase
MFVNAVMWRLKTGAPWRDIPERYGPWKTIYNRFARWAKRGVWEAAFKALRIDDDVGSLIDGTVVRAHQDAAGGKGGSDAMLWAVLEEVFPPRSTRSRRPKANPSTSFSRPANSTTRRKRSV